MKLLTFFIAFFLFSLSLQTYAQPAADKIETSTGMLTVQPIHHGTLVLSTDTTTIYVDPVGGAEMFKGLANPDLILITHAHGDHLSIETLNALNTKNTKIIAPQSVADELPEEYANRVVILANGETTKKSGISIKAFPMYNLPPSKDAYHPKGWGNGYILTMAGKKIYISGDTEGTPEMRALKNIDIAFLCMNLPYTMNVEQAADAVLDFKPAIVYPYHYRGQDTGKFKQLLNAKSDDIDVRLRDWYK